MTIVKSSPLWLALLFFGACTGNALAFTSSEHKQMTHDWVSQSHLNFQTNSLHWFSEAAHTSDRHPWYDDGTWHCDNADYYADASYPKSQDRKQADRQLQACVKHANTSFQQAVTVADHLVDLQGNPVASAVRITQCQFDNNLENPKCYVLGQLGRTMHTMADFYAHSNMVDRADSNRPEGINNPKGLALDHTHTPFKFDQFAVNLDTLIVLDNFEALLKANGIEHTITGCYPDYGYTAGGSPSDDNGYESTGVENCTKRISHDGDNGISKDTEQKPRGKLLFDANHTNFQRARQEAMADFDTMWKDFNTQLEMKYGAKRAKAMINALEKN